MNGDGAIVNRNYGNLFHGTFVDGCLAPSSAGWHHPYTVHPSVLLKFSLYHPLFRVFRYRGNLY